MNDERSKTLKIKNPRSATRQLIEFIDYCFPWNDESSAFLEGSPIFKTNIRVIICWCSHFLTGFGCSVQPWAFCGLGHWYPKFRPGEPSLSRQVSWQFVVICWENLEQKLVATWSMGLSTGAEKSHGHEAMIFKKESFKERSRAKYYISSFFWRVSHRLIFFLKQLPWCL